MKWMAGFTKVADVSRTICEDYCPRGELVLSAHNNKINQSVPSGALV